MGWTKRARAWLFGEPYGPPDRYGPAIAAEAYIGDRSSPNVTISRRRLRDLMRRAFDVGVEWQVEQQAAAEVAGRAEFPPRRIVRGLIRLRAVAAIGFGLWYAWRHERRITGGCYSPSDAAEAFFCLGDGLMGLVVAGAIVSGFAALVLWGAYRVVLWVWRGFREA